MRRKTEYPTWGDVPSEWDDTKTSKKGKAKKKSIEQAKEKKSENQPEQNVEPQQDVDDVVKKKTSAYAFNEK